VLTSHSCSEEGLEDAANVLLQLSRGDAATRDTVLRLLLSGARQLGATLCRQIVPVPPVSSRYRCPVSSWYWYQCHRYFRQELERLDEGLRKEDMAVHVRRDHVFEDSYRELHRKSPEEMKNRLYIVFEGEEGQDAGGLLREWYMIISREMFNPMYALFRTSPGDRVTYTINPSSHCNPNHLSYFKFVGRIVAKAVYDNRLLECYFTRSFYKHILGKSV
ncbi:E3 ubiquitin-protein ligase HUWE1-like, partial [Nothoprocta perdicaria]|uniref:E3 ubiquitin-protein ligase HUWE1-like n=1 Tax=Nothoprocta perdicaria TaxID=30464 RepID=UPI000E1B776F